MSWLRHIAISGWLPQQEFALNTLLAGLIRDDEGQDLAEYAFLLTFIALLCIIGMQNLGTAVNNTFSTVSASITSGS
jgi:Flp pilus assembly pilin Flp